jgi:hypothetical protein
MSQPQIFAKCACQHCGGRIEFPINGAGQKICCPHCEKPTVLFLPQAAPKRNNLVLALVAGVLLAAAGGGAYFYFGSKKTKQVVATPIRPVEISNINPAAPAPAPLPPPKPKPPPDPWNGFKPGAVTLEKSGDGRLIYAIGTLTNATTRQRFGVKVTFDVLDERRNKIGAAHDYTDVIDPGKVWKFRALVTDKNAAAAKLTNVREQE